MRDGGLQADDQSITDMKTHNICNGLIFNHGESTGAFEIKIHRTWRPSIKQIHEANRRGLTPENGAAFDRSSINVRSVRMDTSSFVLDACVTTPSTPSTSSGRAAP
jgi:hypothetical protein